MWQEDDVEGWWCLVQRCGWDCGLRGGCAVFPAIIPAFRRTRLCRAFTREAAYLTLMVRMVLQSSRRIVFSVAVPLT
ncbi:hypothetical protein E2C01_095813 [Portunus trituberculatus]|uniref:Uncharacterized protein n=1 Tax=Portunus trituberculatus TaxID=210409 RepID=A0A5B7K1D6_PORTR|nr:hypothetical protein [Portunus trituberculatus]